jgi:hypothetical protein
VVHYLPSLSFFEIDLTILQREVLKQRKFPKNIVIRCADSPPIIQEWDATAIAGRLK